MNARWKYGAFFTLLPATLAAVLIASNWTKAPSADAPAAAPAASPARSRSPAAPSPARR